MLEKDPESHWYYRDKTVSHAILEPWNPGRMLPQAPASGVQGSVIWKVWYHSPYNEATNTKRQDRLYVASCTNDQ